MNRSSQRPTLIALAPLKKQLKGTVHTNGIVGKLPVEAAFEVDETLTLKLQGLLMRNPNTTHAGDNDSALEAKTVGN